MKKILKVLLCSLVLGGALTASGCSSSNVKKEIAIVKFGNHTSLNEIEEAIKTVLNDKIDENKYYVKTYDCSFDSSITTNTITGLKNKKLGAIVPIATPVAQVAANQFDDVPIIFSAVSSPSEAGLVENVDAPEGNVTGTSDEIQISLLLDKALEVNPSLKKLGFIYNPNESNSVVNKGKIEKYCQEKEIELVTKTISQSAEITEVFNSMKNNIEAMVVTDDNTVASAMGTLASLTRKENIPLYCGADSEVKDGGMLCVGINYTLLGTYTGNMVIDVLEGKKIKDIPVKVFKDNLNIYMNTTYIEETNIVLPSSIMNDSSLIKYSDK